MNLIKKIYNFSPPFIQNIGRKVYSRFKKPIWKDPEFLKWYNFLQESQWWSREKLEEYQMRQLSKLLHHAYENVPYYRRVFDERGLKPKDIQDFKDLRKLPILTKEIIRKNFNQLIARNIKRRDLVESHTSGSTGAPFKFLELISSAKIEAAFIYRIYNSWGYNFGEKTIMLRSYVPQNREPLVRFNRSYNILYFSSYHLTKENVIKYVELMNNFGARILIGYPSSVYILALFLKKTGLKLPHIQRVHVASEKLLKTQAELIENVLGIKPTEHYGLAEKVVLLHRCGCSPYFHENMEYGIFETENITFNRGTVVGTSLFNYAFPLIRYKPNDIAILNTNNTPQKCPCGRGLPLTVKEIEGREDDIIITPEGAMLPGVNFYTMFYKLKEIEMFELIQENIDSLTVNIVPSKHFNRKTYDNLIKGLKERVGSGMKININKVNEIKRDLRSGKVKCIINKINGQL